MASPEPEIPPVDVATLPVDGRARAELAYTFTERLQEVDLQLRKYGAGGALFVAFLMYALGAWAIIKINALLPCDQQTTPVTASAHQSAQLAASATAPASGIPVAECPKPRGNDHWHVVVASLVALFSVPTVLIVAVLRATSNGSREAGADSMHAVIGEKVLSLVEKGVERLGKD